MAVPRTAYTRVAAVRRTDGVLPAHLSAAATRRVHVALASVQSHQRDHIRRAHERSILARKIKYLLEKIFKI